MLIESNLAEPPSPVYIAAENKTSSQEVKIQLAREEYMEVESNVRLNIRDWGKGNPIVFIHGWPLSGEIFEYQFYELIQKGFRCISITLRGFGKSDQPYSNYNFDLFADDIHKILCKLGLNNVTLVGHSMGGAIAIRYMSRHLQTWVSKLVLISAAAPLWVKRDGYPYGIAKEKIGEMISLCNKNRPQLINDYIELFFNDEDSVSFALVDWLVSIGLQSSPYTVIESLVALRDTDLRGDLAQISVPTTILHGSKDKVCSFDLAKQIHAGIKNSSLKIFENSGHGLLIEEKEKINKELADFANSD